MIAQRRNGRAMQRPEQRLQQLQTFCDAIAGAAAFAGGLLFASAIAHAATFNKCYDLDGTITYQQSPCDPTSLPSTVETHDRKPVGAPAAGAAPAADSARPTAPATARDAARPPSASGSASASVSTSASTAPSAAGDGKPAAGLPVPTSESPYTGEQLETASDTIAEMDRCAKQLPNFAANYRGLIDTWKSGNAGVIRAVEENVLTREKIQRARTETTALPERERARLQTQCDSFAVRVLGKKISASGVAAPRANVRD
jgi:hypothetical protein